MQTTEELKRAMYKALDLMRAAPYASFSEYEDCLERYLEAIRVEQAQAAARIETLELAAASSARLAQESTNTNRLAGEELRRRGEIIEQQRQEIDALRNDVDRLLALLQEIGAKIKPFKAYHMATATSHQEKRENAQEAPAAKPQGHLAMFNWLIRICRGMK